jgi:multiple sugar transport system permease protein
MAAREMVVSGLRRRNQLSHVLERTLFFTVVTAVVFATLFPLYWMFITSARALEENGDFPPGLFPHTWNWLPYTAVFSDFPLAQWLFHSLEVGLLVTVIVLFFATLGAYALSCLRWAGRTAFGFFLFFTQMMPEAMIVIPIYTLYRQLHVTENLPALAVVDAAFVIPVGSWILKAMFDSVPLEVREAALVDGCGELGVLFRIILPLSTSAMVAVSVSAFFYGWNEYLFASTMVTNTDIQPASLGLASFLGFSGPLVNRVMAAGFVYALPPTIFYLLAQRRLVVGITAGAVKG